MPWRCAKCKTLYATRNKQRCDAVVDGKVCGRLQPKKRPGPAHRAVLEELSYADFVAINGGDFCWIGRFLGESCGKERNPKSRRLHRDHAHEGDGVARGLLCWWHNKFLVGRKVSAEEARAVFKYLERAENLERGKDD